jgi:hypothetical protein
MNLDTRVTVPPQVMAREVGGETVLLDLASGMYFGIDEVGTRIWVLLGEGKTLGEVAATIAEEYDATLEQIHADTLEFVGLLVDKGLVSAEAGSN